MYRAEVLEGAAIVSGPFVATRKDAMRWVATHYPTAGGGTQTRFQVNIYWANVHEEL